MKRTTVNLVVDTLLAATALVLVGTGILLWSVLPPGMGRGASLWGLDRHSWGDIHLYAAWATMGLTFIHVFFHWSWILNVVGGQNRTRRFAAGWAVLLAPLALLAGFWALAARQVRQSNTELTRPSMVSPKERDTEHHSQTTGINGSMSLTEIAVETGLTLAEVKRRLGLSAEASGSERLGQLAKRFSFTLAEARVRLAGGAH
jgi:hypothetical protein